MAAAAACIFVGVGALVFCANCGERRMFGGGSAALVRCCFSLDCVYQLEEFSPSKGSPWPPSEVDCWPPSKVAG